MKTEAIVGEGKCHSALLTSEPLKLFVQADLLVTLSGKQISDISMLLISWNSRPSIFTFLCIHTCNLTVWTLVLYLQPPNICIGAFRGYMPCSEAPWLLLLRNMRRQLILFHRIHTFDVTDVFWIELQLAVSRIALFSWIKIFQLLLFVIGSHKYAKWPSDALLQTVQIDVRVSQSQWSDSKHFTRREAYILYNQLLSNQSHNHTIQRCNNTGSA